MRSYLFPLQRSGIVMKSTVLRLLPIFLLVSCSDSTNPVAPTETGETLRKQPAPPPSQLTSEQLALPGQIVFTRRGAGEVKGIYVINADGSGIAQLTSPAADRSHRAPAWSPDGGRIAFADGTVTAAGGFLGDLFVMNADGSQLTRLGNFGGAVEDLDWAPHGESIVFQRGNGGFDIWVADDEGSSAVNLADHPAQDEAPSWGRGGQIAFHSNRAGDRDIWVMNADGSNLRQLTDEGSNFRPAWSPDGSKIAFESTRSGFGDIWIMNADGSSPVNLTNDSSVYIEPAWSPDGEWLVFSRIGGSGGGPPPSGLYVIDKTGSNLTFLPNTVFADGQPDWTFGETADLGPDVPSLLYSAKNRLRALLGPGDMRFATADIEIRKSLSAIEEGRDWEARLRIWGLALRIESWIACCIPEDQAIDVLWTFLRPAWDLQSFRDVPNSPTAAKIFAEVLIKAAISLSEIRGGIVSEDEFRSVAWPLDGAFQAATARDQAEALRLFREAGSQTADPAGPWQRFRDAMSHKEPRVPAGFYHFAVVTALRTAQGPWN